MANPSIDHVLTFIEIARITEKSGDLFLFIDTEEKYAEMAKTDREIISALNSGAAFRGVMMGDTSDTVFKLAPDIAISSKNNLQILMSSDPYDSQDLYFLSESEAESFQKNIAENKLDFSAKAKLDVGFLFLASLHLQGSNVLPAVKNQNQMFVRNVPNVWLS